MGMLDGKKGVVTGGGSGLGRANSLGLAAQGAEIAVADLNLETAQKTVSDIEAAGGRGIAIQADVSQGSDVQSLVDRAVQAMGRLDLLVNCAGILPKTPLVDMSEEEWRRVMDINMTSMFFTCRAAARQMIAQGGGGKMVNFASGRGRQRHGERFPLLRVQGGNHRLHGGHWDGAWASWDQRQRRLSRRR